MRDGTVLQTAEAAKAASRLLGALDEAARNAALAAMADAVEQASAALYAANELDLAAAAALPDGDALPPSTLSRLRLNDAKLAEMVEQIRSVRMLPDPLGRRLDAIELDSAGPSYPTSEKLDPPADPEKVVGHLDSRRGAGLHLEGAGLHLEGAGLHLEKVSVPLGVLAVIFEARPDAVTQIAALALKSGNAVILKPGKEVEHTALALVELLRAALRGCGLGEAAVSVVFGRERVQELLALHGLVDMVIPRGSKALVEYVQANTRIPVLGHAEGVCHIYVDRAADEELALRVIADAKLDYPAACNAVETVLVHRDLAVKFVPKLAEHLRRGGVVLHGDARVQALVAGVQRVDDWHCEYGEPELAIGVVDSIDAAIAHVHAHGSSHTESILTEDAVAAEKFLREVDAAGVFHNASTRFADGFRYGFGAEVGISTSKLHARGPVGLEGLTTYKYLLRGRGHVAGEYRGADGKLPARKFTHRREA